VKNTVPTRAQGVDIGLYVEAQEGVDWHAWHRLATRAEALGFSAIACSVHLMSLQSSGRWALDVWPLLTALALWTRRVRFGPMVLPVTFDHPIQIARRAASLDRLTGGRFRLRLGAGRHPGEHAAFGVPFPQHDQRIAMLDEAVQVIRLLWSGEPVSFAGAWYRLERAQLQPVPGHPWIGMSGDSESSLRVTAAGADEWCTADGSMEALRQRLGRLDELAGKAGRNPRAISRSVMNGVLVGHNRAALRRQAARLVDLIPAFAGLPADTILERLMSEWGWWVGTPQQVAEQVTNVIRAGVDDIFFQVFDFRDLRMLDLLARDVIPRLGLQRNP